jgi:fructose-1,6-bisphosphatase/inositol monophosphatase family enzyme
MNSYDRTVEGVPWLMARMTALLAAKAQSVRMFGSCALNMCAGTHMHMYMAHFHHIHRSSLLCSYSCQWSYRWLF